MAASRPSTLKTAVTRTVLWIVATVVAASVGLREYWRVQDSSSVQARGAYVVSGVLASQFKLHACTGVHPTPQSRDFWNEVCDRLLCHPTILGVWLISENRNILGMAVSSPQLDGRLPGMPFEPGRQREIPLPPRNDRPAGNARLVDVPLSINAGGIPMQTPSILRVLIAWARPPEPWYQRLWLSCTPLLAVGAVGSAIGLRRLYRQVVDPVTEINRLAKGDPMAADGLGTHQANELNEIARALAQLRADRDAWRSRAEQSARAAATNVAEATHAIYEELRRTPREAWRDGLTGLNTRGALADRLEAIIDAQREAGLDLSLVLMDIDYLKVLNDTLGHPIGDDLLRFTADLMRGALRTDDIAVRYDGDRFALVLPSVSASDAVTIARRLVSLFGQRSRLFNGVFPRPSLSAGVVSLWADQPDNADALMQLAEAALAEAKAAGRNQVATYRPPKAEREAACAPAI